MNTIIYDFVMKTLEKMKEKYGEFHTREYALKWFTRGVLTEADLETIDKWFVVVEETVEDIPEEVVTE